MHHQYIVLYLYLDCAVYAVHLQRGPNKERYKPTAGRFGAKKVDVPKGKAASSEPLIQDVLSAAFLSSETLVTGCQDGTLLVWDVEGSRSAGGGCVIDVSSSGLLRSPTPHPPRAAPPRCRPREGSAIIANADYLVVRHGWRLMGIKEEGLP